ncbi:helix-turn-helix domain-containing protein [Planobispora siamensis]|uniref:Uncharacterized protein n=1 Tax=Planobispora siamensis TaxID=936338 RepID=A0A8J3SC59_9ACTN|nr:helix-turn-helix domain-containing protein [Planobispora siamensis]GIH91961.1 hypothetical protein Psi01_25910 [Planobispora siamensis]
MTTSPAAAFYRRAEQERTRRGMSKSDVIRQAGVGRNTYTRLAVSRPRPAAVLAVARALDIDADEALALAGLAVPSTRVQLSEVADSFARLVRQEVPDVDGATIARVLRAAGFVLTGAAIELDDT